MRKMAFVMGSTATGKTHFIENHLSNDNSVILNIGHFRVLGPRTCGECPINATLFWRINTEKKVSIPIVIEGMLTKEERITWHRIKAEPESLLEEETEEVIERYEDCCDISSIKKP